MSVTCTYVQKVQHKSPGHLACKALEKSDLAGNSHPANIPRTSPSVDVPQRAANAMTCPNLENSSVLGKLKRTAEYWR
jgi:hypothetical protein